MALQIDVPPFDRFLVRLRLTTPARFRFLHGGVLRGLVSAALGRHDLPPGVIPAAPESGRVRYASGDAYQLGLTLAGEARRLGGRLFAGLVRVGAERPGRGAPPTLGGNFEVEALQPLPAVDLDAEAAALAAAEEVTMEWLSPLRLRRPDDLVAPGAAYLNGDCFPATHFLERLWCRFHLLAHGEYPDGQARDAVGVATAGAEATAGDLPWVDLPVAGAPAKRRAYTLGGVLGRVRWRQLSPAALALLAAGRHLNAGAGTGYALGRYRWAGAAAGEAEPFRPARQQWPSAGDGEGLRLALEALLEESGRAHRLGLSRSGAARAERRAVDDGFTWRRPLDLAALARHLPPKLLADRLRSTLPLDFDGGEIGTPALRLDALSPGLRAAVVSLWLPEVTAALGNDRRLLRQGEGFYVHERRGCCPAGSAAIADGAGEDRERTPGRGAFAAA